MNNKVIASGIWFTIGNFIVRGIGFLTTPIFTRLLTKSEYGDYNNFFTWMTIALIVTSLNLEASLIRARFDFEKELKSYVSSMVILSSLSTLIWFGVVIIWKSWFVNWFAIDFKYICCMFIYLFFYPIINLFQTMERFEYKYKWTVAISLIVAITTSLVSVILVYLLPNHLTGRIIGYTIPIGIIGMCLIVYFILSRPSIKISYWKYALPFTLPFIPHLLAMNLLSGMDRLMIKQYCGAEDLAIYSLAYTCGSIITILVASINSAFSPWLGEMLSQKNYKTINKMSIPYVAAFCYCAGGAILIIPEILFILGGKPYIEAQYVMPPVAASTILQFIYCMYVNVEQYEKKTKLMAVASISSVIINYILNFIFISQFGYIAAAYTTYVSYLVLMVLHMLIVNRIGKSIVYKNKKILILALSISGLMFATTFLMDKILIRYIIVIFYFVFGCYFIYKNKLLVKKMIKRSSEN